MRALPAWTEPPFSLEGDPVRVVGCPSSLAVRAELAERDDPTEWLVILTDRDERDLGADVLGRLVRRRLHTLDPWNAVAASFGATGFDSSLRKLPELASALLEHRPPSGYARTPGAVLDRDTAWLAFCEHVLGLRGLDRDPQAALLAWLSASQADAVVAGLGEHLAEGVWEWLDDRAGDVSTFAANLLRAGRGRDSIALGLSARLLLGHDDLITSRVRGRFEAITGTKLTDSALSSLTDAAERSAEDVDRARSDAVLQELDAGQIVYRSDFLPSAFAARLARAGEALLATLDAPAELTAAADALKTCELHRDSVMQAPRLDAVRMALRLARFLAAPRAETPASLADAANSYAGEGAFVDMARRLMWRGESEPSLIRAYKALDDRLLEVREKQNRRFAELLADWLGSASSDPRIIAVEDLLSTVVAPLATRHPVMVIVLDGMGWATWEEFVPDFDRLGWEEVIDERVGSRRVGVATVPSLTTYSRTSLLCGETRTGTQKDEKAGFPAALAPAGAVLFHKADLIPAQGSTVAPDVLQAIADARTRVVGVVINEIDDALSGGLLPDRRFRVAEIGPLMRVLEAAFDAGRVCIVTADHGYLVDYEGKYRSSEGRSERWRPATGGTEEGEILLTGRRVLAGDGRVVAPWTERVRYTTGKSAGYHGGATPQEMLVPAAVLVPRGVEIGGYQPAAPAQPQWWDEGASVPELALVRGVASPVDAPPREPSWIAELLRSSLYASQRERFGRTAPDDERVRRILAHMAARGDRGTVAGIAQTIDAPEHRARGALAGLRRVLAVDGFDVLTVSDEDVLLNRNVLVQQFGLGGGNKT
ncbi:MAG: BREX-2 system phosphatase PglZ [Gaiellaceae bacterium MAG52_C11]|nr:BREX-2 system phosphatase PglZ [Candidatus Gaiellasilicea maunaloa]